MVSLSSKIVLWACIVSAAIIGILTIQNIRTQIQENTTALIDQIEISNDRLLT